MDANKQSKSVGKIRTTKALEYLNEVLLFSFPMALIVEHGYDDCSM